MDIKFPLNKNESIAESTSETDHDLAIPTKDPHTSQNGNLLKSEPIRPISMGSKSTQVQSDLENEKIFAKYNFFWISKSENDKVYSVLVELPQQCTVYEAIQILLPYFNQELTQKSELSLKQDPGMFEVYFARKTGHPKTDYPALDNLQNLNQTGIQNFCLVEKEESAILGSPPQTMKNTSVDSKMVSPNFSLHTDFRHLEKAGESTYQKEKKQYNEPENEEGCCACFVISSSKKRAGTITNANSQENQTSLTENLLPRKN